MAPILKICQITELTKMINLCFATIRVSFTLIFLDLRRILVRVFIVNVFRLHGVVQ